MLITKTNPFLDLPFSCTHSLRLFYHLLPCSHSPSKFLYTPYLGRSIPWQGFLASEGQTTKAYTCLKTIILFITCSWKSMDIIGYQCPTMALLLKCFTNILLLVSIPFIVANPCSNFQPPQTKNFHAFVYQAHNLHYTKRN